MSKSPIGRRDFLYRASMAAFSTALLGQARGQSRVIGRQSGEVAGVASAGSLSAQANGHSPNFVIADTCFGKVRGIDRRGIKIFKGIPYGADTGGANRFMAPADPAPWTGVRDALEYGHSAPQSAPPDPERKPAASLTPSPTPPPTDPPTNPFASKPATGKPAPGPSIYKALGVPGDKPTGEGEDCLVLNVWTPAVNDGRKRPVMLWLHGGGFGSGSGSNPGWDGTRLALRGDVVVITINHRLNVMGFANLSAFSPDFAASGDAGMLDIVHALKWVRTNIAQFGGDPGTVMIFGQSGGGRKCETLLAMPSAKGLFHRAAIESGVAIKVADQDIAIRNGEMLLARLGISKKQVHDIQRLPLEKIMAAYFAISREIGKNQAVSGFVPTAGNAIIPLQPFHPTASPISPDVPVIIGHTRTEWTGLTTESALWRLDEDGMRVKVKELLGDRSQAMIDLYRRHNPGATPSDIFFLIASDYSYGGPTLKIAERRAALGSGPVYLYYFAWDSPVQGGLLHAPHNIEWPFAFDNAVICANLTGGGPDAIALADKVSDAWIAFARTGDPNTSKLPHWPAFNATDRATMIFDNTSKVVNDPLREQRIAMFEALDLA